MNNYEFPQKNGPGVCLGSFFCCQRVISAYASWRQSSRRCRGRCLQALRQVGFDKFLLSLGWAEDDEKLTKKALMARCTFQMNDYVELIDSGKRDRQGKPVKYQKRTKISQQGLVNYDGGETPEP